MNIVVVDEMGFVMLFGEGVVMICVVYFDMMLIMVEVVVSYIINDLVINFVN